METSITARLRRGLYSEKLTLPTPLRPTNYSSSDSAGSSTTLGVASVVDVGLGFDRRHLRNRRFERAVSWDIVRDVNSLFVHLWCDRRRGKTQRRQPSWHGNPALQDVERLT